MVPGAAPEPVDPRIGAAVAGDRKAAQEIMLELLPRVRNLVRYIIRGDHDVDDIAQEALIAVLRGLPGYRGDGKFRSWADRIVARTTFAWLKAARRPGAQVAVADLAVVVDPGSGPDAYLARREAVALLDQIPQEQRNVVVLHHVLEMTVPEIAEELGIPFETVRSRLRLAKSSLRAQQKAQAEAYVEGEPA